MEAQLAEKSGREKYTTVRNGRTPENGKESPHSAHANGMNE
jgi:hypothetical protein